MKGNTATVAQGLAALALGTNSGQERSVSSEELSALQALTSGQGSAGLWEALTDQNVSVREISRCLTAWTAGKPCSQASRAWAPQHPMRASKGSVQGSGSAAAGWRGRRQGSAADAVPPPAPAQLPSAHPAKLSRASCGDAIQLPRWGTSELCRHRLKCNRWLCAGQRAPHSWHSGGVSSAPALQCGQACHTGAAGT